MQKEHLNQHQMLVLKALNNRKNKITAKNLSDRLYDPKYTRNWCWLKLEQLTEYGYAIKEKTVSSSFVERVTYKINRRTTAFLRNN